MKLSSFAAPTSGGTITFGGSRGLSLPLFSVASGDSNRLGTLHGVRKKNISAIIAANKKPAAKIAIFDWRSRFARKPKSILRVAAETGRARCSFFPSKTVDDSSETNSFDKRSGKSDSDPLTRSLRNVTVFPVLAASIN